MEDVHPKLVEFLEGEAEGAKLEVGQLRSSLERQMGLDLADIEDDDAVTFVESIEGNDVDSAIEILEKYDVPDDVIAQSKAMWEQNEPDGDVRGNGEAPSSNGEDGDSEYLTRQEAEAMIPSADEIAAKLRSQMGGGGGGGGGQQPAQQPAQGQGNQNAQLGQLISLAQMFSGGGGGAMSEMGEKATERVMERTMERLAEPSFGEQIGKAIEQKAAQQVADDVVGGMDLDMDPDGETDDDTDHGTQIIEE